jgi:hypothetical protein
MPLGTSWSDIGRLLFYGALCSASFLGAALIHWFVTPQIRASQATKNVIDVLLLISLVVVVHRVWAAAIRQTKPSQQDSP